MTEETNETYEQLLEDSAHTKMDAAEHRTRYGRLKKLYKMMFENDPRNFKHGADMLYYKGGYPKPDSRPKIADCLDKFGVALQTFAAMGREDQIASYLAANFGINVEFIGENPLTEGVCAYNEKVEKLWGMEFPGDRPTMNKAEAFKQLMESAQATQCDICIMSDEVKITKADKVLEEFGIKKGNFMKAVGIKVAALNDKHPEEKIQKIQDDRENLDEALAPFTALASDGDDAQVRKEVLPRPAGFDDDIEY